MVDYNKFCEEVKKDVLKNMSKSFHKGYEAIIEPIKVGEKETEGLKLVSHREETENVVAPVLALEAVYKKIYLKSGDLDGVIQDIALKYEKAYRNSPLKEVDSAKNEEREDSGKEHYDKEPVEPEKKNTENIFYVLIHNVDAELLRDIPYVEKNGMTIVFREMIEKNDDTLATQIITHNKMKSLGLDVEELYQIACKNTPLLFPPEVKEVSKVGYMITNTSKVFGASTLLYEKEHNPIEALAKERSEEFLMIIPCGSNEVFAIPLNNADEISKEEYKKFINMYSHMTGKAPVSDNVFVYSKTENKIDFKHEMPKMNAKTLI